jgi:hypothetical protein
MLPASAVVAAVAAVAVVAAAAVVAVVAVAAAVAAVVVVAVTAAAAAAAGLLDLLLDLLLLLNVLLHLHLLLLISSLENVLRILLSLSYLLCSRRIYLCHVSLEVILVLLLHRGETLNLDAVRVLIRRGWILHTGLCRRLYIAAQHYRLTGRLKRESCRLLLLQIGCDLGLLQLGNERLIIDRGLGQRLLLLLLLHEGINNRLIISSRLALYSCLYLRGIDPAIRTDQIRQTIGKGAHHIIVNSAICEGSANSSAHTITSGES